MAGSGNPCIYCGEPADTEEHILATWLMAELGHITEGQLEYGDGRVRPIPVTLNRKGRRQFDFTSDTICARCNSGWMNRVDERVRPYIGKMLRGEQVPLSGRMRKATASWAVKTAITTRFAHINPDATEGGWAEQLRLDNSHLPSPFWFVWLARYVGGLNLWFRQGPFEIQGQGRLDGGPEGGMPHFRDGVVMTLILGQLCVQVLRINATAAPIFGESPLTVQIWPDASTAESWPPSQQLDDSSREAFSNRFYNSPMAFALHTEASEEQPQPVVFRSSTVTPEMLADDSNYVMTFGIDCACGTHTDLPHDTGGPFRELKLPYTAVMSGVCGGCGAAIGGQFSLAQVPGV